MRTKLHCGFSLLLFFLSLLQASAQSKSADHQETSQPASFAIRLGATRLFGDLKDPEATPIVGISLMMPLTKTVTVELPVDFGTLKSQQDEFYHSVAKTKFRQVAAIASIEVLDWFNQKQTLFELRPYAGAGLLFFRSEAFDLKTGKLQRTTNNQNSHRSRDGIEAKGKAGIKMTHELAWVMGLRGSTAVSRRMSIFGDIRFNLVRSDKLDATLDNNNQIMQANGPAFTEGNHYGKNSNDKWGLFVSRPELLFW
jgi:outer membrane protein W